MDLFPSDSVCGLLCIAHIRYQMGTKVHVHCIRIYRPSYLPPIHAMVGLRPTRIRTVGLGSDHGGENVEKEVIQGEYQVDLFGLRRILLTLKCFCPQCFCPQC